MRDVMRGRRAGARAALRKTVTPFKNAAHNKNCWRANNRFASLRAYAPALALSLNGNGKAGKSAVYLPTYLPAEGQGLYARHGARLRRAERNKQQPIS